MDTPEGSGILQKVYLTELGFIMGKVFFPKTGIFINYKLAELENNNTFNINKSINVKRNQLNIIK